LRSHRARLHRPERFRAELWVAVAGVLVFSAVLGHGFVYDDSWTIVENRWLERPFGELSLLLASGEALAKSVPDATRPAMVLSLWLERRIFGDSPLGPHLVSLVLYGVNCLLATALVARLTGKKSVSLVAGAFFALAPLHAEPVAAVNYREDLLSGAGVLGAWLCALGPHRRQKREKNEWRRAYAAAAAWAIALFAKESAFVLVLLLGATALLLPRELRRARRTPRLFAPLLAVAVVWSLWRLNLSVRGDDIPLSPSRGAVETGFRTARFLCLSVWNGLFPFDWAPDHWRKPDASVFWLAPLALLVAVVVALARSRRGRVAAIGLVIAFVAPTPSSPLVGPVNEIADRYFFLAVLGGGIVWGAALALLGQHLGLRGRRRAFLVLACAPLVIPTWQASKIWRDERSLWIAAVERQPASPRAWAALSRVHRMAGEHDAAAVAVERAINLDPSYPPALVTRVYNEVSTGRIALAREHLKELEHRGLGDYKGVKKARRCLMFDGQAARDCLVR
jgi:hypothetical protein